MLFRSETEWVIMALTVAAFFAAYYFTRQMFVVNSVLPAENEEKLRPWQKLIAQKYRVDELYDSVFKKPIDALSAGLRWVDEKIIGEMVNGVGTVVTWSGSQVRRLQTGNIGFYIFGMVIGIILILFFGVLR